MHLKQPQGVQFLDWRISEIADMEKSMGFSDWISPFNTPNTQASQIRPINQLSLRQAVQSCVDWVWR